MDNPEISTQARPSEEELQVILFRSRLTSEAGEDYRELDAELEKLVQQNPGFIAAKSYKSEDGERLTVVWWRDEKSLGDWRNLPLHRQAQETGRKKWYQYYKVDVARITRSKSFER